VSGKPLLALVMIVKDEAKSIVQTIRSCLPIVDRVVILDTGSTDGTQALVHETCKKVDYELHEAEFVDYSTTRNEVLDIVGESVVFTLMLSGDETLLYAKKLRDFCERFRDAEGEGHGAYYVTVELGKCCRFLSPRLARTSDGWRYEGVVHEILTKPGQTAPQLTVPEAYVYHQRTSTKEQMRATWLRHKQLLEEELKRRPGHPRTTFYLAQTLQALGQNEQAQNLYESRAKMAGWKEETFIAIMRRGDCFNDLGQWQEAQTQYLLAYSMCPYRAEPLCKIANHYYDRHNLPLVHLFASRAAKIPYPKKAKLFVDPNVYSFQSHDLLAISSYYVSEFEEGRLAAMRALGAHPDDERLQKNLEFYPRPVAKPRNESHCIIVTGSGRSGTSMIAGLLDRLGVFMGRQLISEDMNNRFGTYEDAYALMFANKIKQGDEQAEIGLRHYLLGRANHPGAWGAKAPVFCDVWPQIESMLPKPYSVIVVERDLREVARSFVKAYGDDHPLLAEMPKRQMIGRRIVEETGGLLLRFAEVLADPSETVERICKFLPPSVTSQFSTEARIEATQSVRTPAETG
jgi:tetratricopeptide (TPR) repeat protein